VINQVLEKIMTFLNISQATVALYDPATDDLVVTAAKGVQIPNGIRIKMGDGPIGRAAQTRQLVAVEEYTQGEGRLPEFGELPYSTRVHIPMMYRGDLVGVLGVAVTAPAHQFNQEEMHLLNLFAEQAASAIKNVRLFEDTHRRLQIMVGINDISTSLRVAQKIDDILPVLLEKTTSMVNAIMGSIWLYDPADDSLHKIVSNGIPHGDSHLNSREGIIGRVFSTGQPYYLPDLTEERVKSTSNRSQFPPGTRGAFIPIRTTHAVVGELVLGFHSPFELSEDQKQLVTTIAEMAGNAIHRMQLHEQTVSQLKRLSALHQIDLAITRSLDLKLTLQVLLDQVTSQLGVDAACALTYNPHEQTLEFAASRGFTTDALRNTHLPLGQGYAGLAAKEQRTINIPDLNTRVTDFLHSPSFSAEGFVAYYAVPLVVRSQIKGVLELFHRSRLENTREWIDVLEALASQAAIAIENASLYSDLQQSNFELNLAYNSTLEGWSRALDLRDKETEGHSQRVTELSLRLAKAMSIDEVSLVHLRRGALLHDIGKLGVPDRILQKPGPLTEDEWAVMHQHPTYAYNLLSPITYLRPAIDIPYCHHEKWDGSGYPRGLKGEEIPLSARIFAIVDVWDSLTSDRPYRAKWTRDEARAYIQEQAGKHFDPHIVDAFLTIINI
jgi:HD-GYP domain-containing protein (c-di-GMP phosphodiesterase class II)